MINKNNLKRKNFSPDEFFVSDTAERLNINNYPSKEEEQSILHALMSTADMMQDIRTMLGKPIKISSAYRCLQLNRAIGSKDTSQHLQGLACDFTCSGFGTPEEIVKYLFDEKFVVDQCFNEGSWVHISRKLPKEVMAENPNRMMYGYYLPDETGKRKFKAL